MRQTIGMNPFLAPFSAIFTDNGNGSFSVLRETWIGGVIYAPHLNIGGAFRFEGLAFPQLLDKTFLVQLRDGGAWAVLKLAP